GAVRAAGGGGVPETHGDVVRLGLRLVRRAVGRLAEDLRGEFGGGRGDGDVGAALPAGDQQRPAVALGQGGGPVLSRTARSRRAPAGSRVAAERTRSMVTPCAWGCSPVEKRSRNSALTTSAGQSLSTARWIGGVVCGCTGMPP